MKKKYFKLSIKVLVSCALFSYLAFRVNWLTILNSFTEIQPIWYSISVLVALSSTFVVASKYFLLIKNSAIHHSLLSLVKINLISQFYVIFMPSALGTEAVRWYKVTRNEKGRRFFFTVTLFERIIFILIILIFGFCPLFILPDHPGTIALKNNIMPLAIALLILAGVCLSFFICPTISNKFISLLRGLLPIKWQEKLNHIYQNDSLNGNLYQALFLKIFGLSILWQLIFILRLFLIFKAADIGLNIMEVAWICSLVLLLQVLPISFAGLGIREGAYAYFLSLFNFQPEKGVLIGILFFSQMIIIAMIGWFFELTAAE